jgi:hypothetical protein
MSELKTISMDNATYLNIRANILNEEKFKRYELSLQDFKIIDVNYIKVREHLFNVQTYAFRQLLDILGLNMHNLKSIFGTTKEGVDRTSIELLDNIKASINRRKNHTILVTVRMSDQSITQIANGKAYLPVNTVLNVMDGLANSPDFYVRNFGQDDKGNIFISTLNHQNQALAMGGDESFKFGIDFTGSSTQIGGKLMNERLVCSNGMIGWRDVAGFTYDIEKRGNIADFMRKIGKPDITLFNDYYKNMNRAVKVNMETPASYKEVLNTLSYINKVKPANTTVLPAHNLLDTTVNAFQAAYPDGVPYYPEDYNTPIKRYDLINIVTRISSDSEQRGHSLGTTAERKLQAYGGMLLDKKPDLKPMNVKQLF